MDKANDKPGGGGTELDGEDSKLEGRDGRLDKRIGGQDPEYSGLDKDNRKLVGKNCGLGKDISGPNKGDTKMEEKDGRPGREGTDLDSKLEGRDGNLERKDGGWDEVLEDQIEGTVTWKEGVVAGLKGMVGPDGGDNKLKGRNRELEENGGLWWRGALTWAEGQ